MPNYPTSLDTSVSLPNPTGTATQNNPDHGALHTQENAAIIAVEGKVGIGATVPASNTLLIGTGAGTSAWSGLTSAQLLAILSDETGTGSAVFANTPVLITPKVDTIQENTPGNGVTVAGLNIKSGVIQTANSVPSTAFSTAGTPIQIVSSAFSAVATGTTSIPLDDTIPQNTEGDQYMTLAITPKATTNILVIQSVAYISNSIPLWLISAIFQDTTANALAVNTIYQATATGAVSLVTTHTMAAATIASTTFKVRCGGNSASTTTFNGNAGARQFGTTTKSSIVITEYKA